MSLGQRVLAARGSGLASSGASQSLAPFCLKGLGMHQGLWSSACSRFRAEGLVLGCIAGNAPLVTSEALRPAGRLSQPSAWPMAFDQWADHSSLFLPTRLIPTCGGVLLACQPLTLLNPHPNPECGAALQPVLPGRQDPDAPSALRRRCRIRGRYPGHRQPGHARRPPIRPWPYDVIM